MPEKLVTRRCVLYVGGYEPAPAERQHERFVRELSRFAGTWSLRAAAGPANLTGDWMASWRVETQGPNWRVETDYVLLRWDDFVTADFARPQWRTLLGGMGALGDFILSGTLFRYFATNWRYALFFLYPVLIVLGCAALGVALGIVIAALGFPGWIGAAAGVLVMLGALLLGGGALQLPYLLNDWIFAQEFVRGTRAGLDARVDRFARELVSRLRDGGYDEVLLAGHSFGAAFSIDVIDRALRLDPALGQNGPALNLLSTGSSLLKVALHPAAGRLRDAVARVSGQAGLFWVEYQALVDVINFYKTDPARALRLRATGRPAVHIVRMREMLAPETYRRFRTDFFRLHRQFVMGNDRRYFYDYFMTCCGPQGFGFRVRNPAEAVDGFADDGSLRSVAESQTQ